MFATHLTQLNSRKKKYKSKDDMCRFTKYCLLPNITNPNEEEQAVR